MGVEKFTLCDFDTVEPHNITSQAFDNRHIGMPKVEATRDIILDINQHADVDIYNEDWLINKPIEDDHIVVVAVDNLDVKKKIFEYITERDIFPKCVVHVGLSDMRDEHLTYGEIFFAKDSSALYKLIKKCDNFAPPVVKGCRNPNMYIYTMSLALRVAIELPYFDEEDDLMKTTYFYSNYTTTKQLLS